MLKPLLLTAAALALVAPAIAQRGPRTERVEFAPRHSFKIITGTIKGHDAVRYLLAARGGQKLKVRLQTGNPSNYFNVTAPGAQAAVFVGSSSGNSFTFTIPSKGDYAIDVYLMRDAARRLENAHYTLTVELF
ncbi:hypothetical protein [Sphingomonas kyeonggiensis]|uniref:DNA breaking-rejoining protein n=1 Tax=Sphingomonas kyeonggiensis TaxID=1268553 RepID=A0A7W6JN97_9SPHN|nr:hypothetical protein [Sphingomonas kyeonggiensis]MBB4096520.1 hypothetical protein [Sphingomonas kyeonggiensis]